MTDTHQKSIQEEQYSFPYHYIPTNDQDGFKLFVYWSWGINYISALEFLLAKLEDTPFTRLIDVGCGDGRFVREVSRKFPDREVLGIDTSPRAIALARAFNPGAAFREADILKSELPNDFDVVTLIEVLEHIPVDLASSFLDAVSRLQQPGGRLVITVPHSNRAVQKKHYQHFNSESLAALVVEKYDIQESFFFDRRRWYLKWIRGFMKNRFFILSHTKTLDRLYAFYRRNLFLCTEPECARFGIVAVRRRDPGVNIGT